VNLWVAFANPWALRAYLEGLRQRGVTSWIAACWAEAYRIVSTMSADPLQPGLTIGGETAPIRAELMRFIAEQLFRLEQGR
jgi:hypothetical protein